MANETAALHNTFPRYHRICDRCDKSLNTYGFMQSERETAAGSFRYALCSECWTTIEGKRKSVRENAIKSAMVRHAARYSEAFGQFVAKWYGVRFAPMDAKKVAA